MNSPSIYLNNKKVKLAFYNWKFKTEKKKFEDKLKDHYNLKKCFRKWLKLKNKRRIIDDLINRKKNALEEVFLKKSKIIDNLILNKSKQYFLGRLIKNINNQTVCDMLDNSYINNYKKLFIHKLSIIPNLTKGIEQLEKFLDDLIKKNAFEIIKKKLRLNNFDNIIKNILFKKIKEKFISKIDNKDENNNNKMNKENSNIIKGTEKARKIMDNNLKKFAFNKIKNNYEIYNKYDNLKKAIEKIIKKNFMKNLKNLIDKLNVLNNIQNIIENQKFKDIINKLRDIAKSPEGFENQKKIKCIKLKNFLQKLILDKVKKDAFNAIKKKYNIIKGTNDLDKFMNNRYKKRLLYLIHLIYVLNKPKTSKIKSRYPMFNMTDLSAKIEKLLLKKMKTKFINELKNIKVINRQLNYLFLLLANKIKKETFDALKTIYFVDLLNKVINDIKNKKSGLKKREFINKLKIEADNKFKLEKEDNNNMLNDCLKKWNELSNKTKILNLLKNNLKLRKYFDIWKIQNDLNNIKNMLVNQKRLKDKEEKEILSKYFYKWKEYIDKKNKLSNLNNIKNKEIKEKNNNLLRDYLNKLNDKSIRRRVLNDLRKLSKVKNFFKLLEDTNKKKKEEFFEKLKKIPEKKNILKNTKYIPQKIINTEYTPKKSRKPEYSIIKQNIITFNNNKNKNKINDNINNNINKNINNNINNNIKNNINDNINNIDNKKETRDKSIKKRKVKRNKSKSTAKRKIDKFDKNREKLKNCFKKWKNNIKEMKLKEDFNHIIKAIKKYENKNIMNEQENEELLKKLKKATVYLLMDIYKKNKDLLLKKYFNKWKKNIKEKNKSKKEEPKNKYMKKKLGINSNNNLNFNNDKYKKKLKVKNDKIFTKKKTKINLYQEKINLYNSQSEKIFNNTNPNDEIDNYKRPITESSYNNISSNNPYSFIKKIPNKYPKRHYIPNNYLNNNTIEEIPDKVYISKSIDRRYPKRKFMNINRTVYNDYDDEEDEDEEDEKDEEDENDEEYTLDPYNNNVLNEINSDKKDNNHILDNKNLDKTLSSINYSTNNHFTLIEDSKEVRNPTNYKNNSKYENKNKADKINNLLPPQFENTNNSSSQNNIFTDRKSRNDKIPNLKKYNNYTNNVYNNGSKSQQNRKRNKLESFTVSIPIYNNENNNEEESDIDYINNSKTDRSNNYNNLKNIKYSELKTNKITPEKAYSNFYSNESFKNKYNINDTPFKDYSVKWEKGNSTCAKIIKNENVPQKGDNNLNDYNSFANKGRNNKIRGHNKSKSGFDYIPGNKKNYLNNINNNKTKNNDSSKKKLFI